MTVVPATVRFAPLGTALFASAAILGACADDAARPDASPIDGGLDGDAGDIAVQDVTVDRADDRESEDAEAGCPILDGASQFGYRVVQSFPHDQEAFTQGLVFVREGAEELLYEGTGLVGRSTIRRVVLATGEVTQRRDLPEPFFGEGIVLFDDQLLQLTWQSNTGFVYDAETFDEEATFRYDGEGWGLTHDGDSLIMSNGTATLAFLDPETRTLRSTVDVRLGENTVQNLNELEFIDGEVWANVWRTDRVVRIDPQSGVVTGVIDFSDLLETALPDHRGEDVLNGIAYDAEDGRVFVTGKLWPLVFEVDVVCRPE
ncbi:MAG: glutaminyl-peptide cyclotransferase [Myxococcota bacterium]